ncbi:PREDICTED: interleukin-20 receptor subunit alpha-like isoform X1 [Calidris pugnax]|uniref:interleukin-20 receptor subunit alpha-like isoform X1 n=1 Tax=Calidris pugnax TaxID=198806 RepID=UPI00071DFE58|nr:PREDICTED: interleukin-20 receptor subunit alpha-like isoform X1 [Calidris pugnax]XP_014811562.1 PREDICTED: interleukin-20 receptor subunit alpha-like isoform X1 [Calidris pugnax]
MSPALSLLLSLATCTLLQGTPLPPRDVRLEAQNFHVCLSWEPDPGSPSGTTYQVEWRGRNSPWTKAGACWGNSTGSSWACELYFDDIYDIYWARVRAEAGGELSEWVSSSELQPYRDTMVGPPTLSWLLQGDTLSVNVTLPLTPYRSKAGSYEPVEEVLWKLWYWLSLYEGDVLIQKVPCRRGGEDAPCLFQYLKPRTRYCVRTRAANMAGERSREAKQCLVTPSSPTACCHLLAGFPWLLLAVLSGVFLLLLLSVAGLRCLQLHVFPSPSETDLPKTLALLNGQLSVAIRVPTLELEEDSFALLLPAMLPSRGPPPAELTAPTVRLLLGESLSQDINGYCANGFGPGCHQGRDPSCTRSQLGHAVGSWVPSWPGEDGETCDKDDVLEPLVPLVLTGDSYTGDRDYQTPETWLSLHPQLYSKCQCPALGAGSCLPLPTPGRSFSQEDPQESLSVAGHWVPLKSVKLLGSKEEDGGQLLCALQPLHGCGTEPQPGDSTLQQDSLEQAAPGIPPPCPLSPLPPDTLRATFSGYELHPPVQGEP